MFVVISAYHFGEQHFHGLKVSEPYLSYAFFSAYGSAVIFGLLYASSNQSAEIIYEIASVQIQPRHFLWVTVVSLIVLMFSGWLIKMSGELDKWYFEILSLLLLYLLFYSSSLIWGFAIYFVLWHSLPSLLDQVQFLSGAVNKSSIWAYIKSSLVYWVASIVGLVVFVYVFKGNDKLFLSFFFTFLAAITFPHVLVMHKFFKH